MGDIAKYLNWLCREQANQLVNVATKVIGSDDLQGKTGVMNPDTIAGLEDKICSVGDGLSVVWASVHSLKDSANGKAKVSKTDVEAFRYLAIDIDSNYSHDNGVCATDAERELTLAKAKAITDTLTAYGLPQPLTVMSGNGSLLLFPIDLPNTDNNITLLANLTDVLKATFDDSDCNIDEAVIKDPSRVLGVVGTINRGKPENASEGRLAAMRVVEGEYPPNEPLPADKFTDAINRFIADFQDCGNETTTAPAAKEAEVEYASVHVSPNEEKPWERFNREANYQTVFDILAKHGWKQAKGNKVTRPGKNGGISGSIAANGAFYSFTDKTELQPNAGLSPFTIYLAYEHNGDIKAAVGALQAKYGMPTKQDNRLNWNADTSDESRAKVYPLTELGNAEHFADINRDKVRHVTQWNAWLVWDGKRWARDNTRQVMKLAIKFVRDVMPRHATTLADRKAYLEWAAKSQSESRINSIVSMAKTHLACSTTELDANPNLFNVSNGTIELDTQTFRPHRREDMLTKLSPVEYDPTAIAPTWEKFINRIFQDTNGSPRLEVIDYVKRAVGYTMTADVTGQCLFVLNGKGKNGKTTFVNAVKNVMGEYAKNGMQSLLLKLGDRNGNRNTDDEADLFGTRLVAVSETDEGVRFDASKVKRLVDTDNIRAMRKHEHPFEFEPTHKLWLCCNYMPRVDGNDDAMKRRLKKIPFLVQIPAEERDEHLGDKLKAEVSGILNWMLTGLRSWYADGRKLNEPREVQDAVGEYFHDNDSFGTFLGERIQPSDLEKVEVKQAYADYRLWASQNGLSYPLTKIEFGRRMGERGYPSKASNGVRCYVGCRLKTISDCVDELDETNHRDNQQPKEEPAF